MTPEIGTVPIGEIIKSFTILFVCFVAERSKLPTDPSLQLQQWLAS